MYYEFLRTFSPYSVKVPRIATHLHPSRSLFLYQFGWPDEEISLMKIKMKQVKFFSKLLYTTMPKEDLTMIPYQSITNPRPIPITVKA